jgi:hypothetical protein
LIKDAITYWNEWNLHKNAVLAGTYTKQKSSVDSSSEQSKSLLSKLNACWEYVSSLDSGKIFADPVILTTIT